jgi:hypothetical protein
MDLDEVGRRHSPRPRARLLRSAGLVSLALGVLAIGAAPQASNLVSPATAQAQEAPKLPAPPASGVMGFIVTQFVPPVIQGKDACPDGPALKNREIALSKVAPEDRERLSKAENQAEFRKIWIADVTGPNGTNMCSQYDQFPNRATQRTVQSKFAWGLNMDGDDGDGSKNPTGCTHQNFETPNGEQGIDNQAYRAMGCNLEWRGVDGSGGDLVAGYKQFFQSGEWAQVLLLRGVDSLVNDPDVEVIFANTADRPVLDSAGKFVWNASFTVSDKFPRVRNVLHGKIVNGVLTTEPTLIRLSQVWGQGGARDLRGVRSWWTLNRGRMRLTFKPDGTIEGIVGGYQPLHEFVDSTSMGGMGSLLVAGIDCAGQWNTLKKLADGDRDPKTGQCTTISAAHDLKAVPAFVNDIVIKQKIASK